MSKANAGVGKISRPGSRFTAVRKIQTGNRAAIERHNRQVGEVVYAYNHAQASFLLIFYSIIGWDKHELTRAIWDTQPSDRGQRGLLRAYVTHAVEKKAFQKAIIWCLDAMDIISQKRNDAVHSDISWFYDCLGTGLLTSKNRADRLVNEPLDSIWRDIRGDLSALNNYLSDLSLNLQSKDRWPLTKRPKLKLVSASKKLMRRKSPR